MDMHVSMDMDVSMDELFLHATLPEEPVVLEL